MALKRNVDKNDKLSQEYCKEVSIINTRHCCTNKLRNFKKKQVSFDASTWLETKSL